MYKWQKTTKTKTRRKITVQIKLPIRMQWTAETAPGTALRMRPETATEIRHQMHMIKSRMIIPTDTKEKSRIHMAWVLA